MRFVEDLPCRVRETETLWIPLSDGCRLAARLWLPETAEDTPVPAIVEYLPYRRRDYTRLRNDVMHAYFAGHGYACLRVDLRGTGDSDGLIAGEYLARELDDGVQVLAWIAGQPWCSGKVGMMGISWGGFNALQVAALGPPALEAIITVASTDDRYADDVHYKGGCLICDNLTWSTTMFGFNSRPPDPEIVGARWREMWLERLEHDEPWLIAWLEHQRRDGFWQHGSVCEDFSAIDCPVYAVAGWADGYANAVPRLLAGLSGPRKGLIGPWPHAYPHENVASGPAIGFLQEALRWWDHWLKGIDSGIMNEPMLRAWMQDSVPPAPRYETRPGRWVAEDSWPSPRIEARRLALNAAGLEARPGEERALSHRSPQSLGITVGEWCPYGLEGEMPPDQRIEDGRSLVFDSAPLDAPMEVLGAPAVELELAVDRPTAFVCVRLCEVAPDGASTRVSYGLLNLTHRDGHDNVMPLVPGERIRVRVQLNDVAHAFPAGARLRVAVSTAYWPLVWPSPEPVMLTLFTGASTLELPARPPRPEDDVLAPFAAPECAPPRPSTVLRPAKRGRTVGLDLATGETVFGFVKDRGDVHLGDIDLAIGAGMSGEMRVRDNDPLSAVNEAHYRITMARGPWRLRTEAHSVLSCTRDDFILTASLDAYEGETRVFAKTWSRKIPRDGI